jgi:NADH:ubiquinone oxidoreductase subunit 2 (subunit N)
MFLTINIMITKTIKNIFSSFKINSIFGSMIIISLLSLAGIPPLTGFMPKLIVIFQLIRSNYIVIFCLILGSYINLYYYLNIALNLIIVNIKSTTYHKNNNSLSRLFIISSSILGIIPLLI